MRLIDKPTALARLAAEAGAGCRMCALARETDPIIACEHAVALVDRYAARPGHVMIVLRRHEERIAALAWTEYDAMHRLAWRMSRAIDAVLAPRRIYVAALGSAVPLETSFPHVHLHLIPLADGGETDRPAAVFTWTQGVYVFDDPAEELDLRERLSAAARACVVPAPGAPSGP